MSLEVYGDLWRDYLADVAAARKIRPEDITAADRRACPSGCAPPGGDMAKLALDAKLVDKLAPRDEVRQRMIELVGEDEEKKSFRQVGVADLPRRRRAATGPAPTGKGDAVAVVVAKGDILDGDAARGDDRRRLDRARSSAGPARTTR